MPLDAARISDLATSVGEHALIAFGLAWAALLLVVGVAWHSVHRLYLRRHLPHGTGDANVRAQIAISVFACAALSAALLLFSTLPLGIVGNGRVALADQALTNAMHQSVSAPVIQMFAAVTALANTPVLWTLAIAGAVVLLWHRRYTLAAVWIASIAGNGIVTRILKATFERARPVYDLELLTVQGYSFPSGHSSGAVATYGALAYILIRTTPANWHLPIVLAAASTAFVTGCSRFFLRVHYASDVFAGFASGLAWLSLCVMCAELSGRSRWRSTIERA